MEIKRRYDLDWWRVISILLVYLHHVGMPFNGDTYHIMNANSSKVLDDVMVFFEQFRLPLLFLISGTGTMFAFRKRNWWQFIKERGKRLLLPLIFGVLVIVPPQTYYEFIEQYNSYTDVYNNFSFEVNHLWFIENLFIMSVVSIPLILFLKSSRSKKFIKSLEKITSRKMGSFLWVLPLMVGYILLKKIFPDDSKDIDNLSVTFYYTYFFVCGMLFNSSKIIWDHLKRYRKFNAIIFLISAILFYSYYFLPDTYIAPYLSIALRWSIWYALCSLVGWTLVTTLLGYGQIWFNTKSKLLSKSNEAIYPFYILHQTIIIAVGYYILQLDLPIFSKIGLLLGVSFPLIIITYRFCVYPFKLLRILFGMKPKS